MSAQSVKGRSIIGVKKALWVKFEHLELLIFFIGSCTSLQNHVHIDIDLRKPSQCHICSHSLFVHEGEKRFMQNTGTYFCLSQYCFFFNTVQPLARGR